MRLAADGIKFDPPGDVRVTCCNTDESGTSRRDNDLRWTGDEFMVAYHDENGTFGIEGDLFVQRVDRLGNLIDGPVLVTPDTARRAQSVAMDWNGTEFGLVWHDSKGGGTVPQVYFSRVGCNCTDSDGDHFTTCAGGDCNDEDPFVNPLQVESCVNGLDDDCDSLVDCQDPVTCPATGGSVPGEVAGVVLAGDKETLSWQAEQLSDLYDILRGDLVELRSDGGFSRSECLAWRVETTSHTDPVVPAPGSGSYYLVRGKAEQCRLGSWGSALRDEVQLTCP
jgi:hypothetical protein